MHQRLDDIPWSELKHAYGPATDVPGLLRELASPKFAIRDGALDMLYGKICHQGTHYTATPYAIPFVYELLENPVVENKPGLIYFLVDLALGFPDSYLPQGVSAASLRKELNHTDQILKEEERAECAEFGCGPLIDLACFENAMQGAHIFQKLAVNPDSEIRMAALYALAWFSDHADAALSVIDDRLGIETEAELLSTAILSAGLLVRSADKPTETLRIAPFLDRSELILRVSAAIAMANSASQPALIRILCDGVAKNRELKTASQHIPFKSGDLSGYAVLALATCGAPSAKAGLQFFLEAIHARDCSLLSLTYGILTLAFGGREFDASIKLTAEQRQAVKTLVEFGDFSFVNFGEVLAGFGLPRERPALRQIAERG